MTDSPKIEKIYQCLKCTCRFEIPLRVYTDEGEYNACSRCESLNIKSTFQLEGVGEFEREAEAYRAYFNKEDSL